ncbi:MAG: rod shape-determining protein MreC [Candidatus Limnocylindrales bacterium]
MFASRASRRRSIAYILLLVASLLLLALSDTGVLRDVRAGASFALTPIQTALADLTRGATSLFATLGEIDRLQRDNRDLQARNDALEAENRRLAGLAATNQTLTDLLHLKSTLEYRTVAAEVISRQISQVERVISLGSGSDSGISVGDVVVAGGAALVGRVVEVGPNYSRVLLISDTRSTVIGLTQGSQATGNVEGELGGALSMGEIASTDTVAVGDEVVTAGIDLGNGIRSPFPKGLLIGRIVEVHSDPIAVVQTAFVEAAAPLDKLEYVLVITDYQGGIPIAPSPSPDNGGGSSPVPGGSPSTPPIELPSPSV